MEIIGNNKPKRVIEKIIEDIDNGCGKISLYEKIILEIKKNDGDENSLQKSQDEINKIYGKSYLDKMKREIKKHKISYTSDVHYIHKYAHAYSSGIYYRDYINLIVKHPKNIIYLKLVPAALADYQNKIKYCFNNTSIDQLYLDVYLHKQNNITSKLELAIIIDLLKSLKIKTLSINLKYTIHFSVNQQIKYNRLIKELKLYLQKYCHDTYVIIHFGGINFNCDFWNNVDCAKTHTIKRNNLNSNGCPRINYAIIDKTRYNLHRNFRLEQRKIKHNR